MVTVPTQAISQPYFGNGRAQNKGRKARPFMTFRPMVLAPATALRRSDLFGALPEDLLQRMAILVVSCHLARGQVLVSEHRKATGVYVVVQGELRSIRQSFNGREQVLSTEHAGATLGVVAAFSGEMWDSTLIAETSTEVLCIAKRDLHRLCHEHPEILWNVAIVLAGQVRHHAELIKTLVFQNVEERLAQYLPATIRQRGVCVDDGCAFEMKLTRAEMASWLGSVREVVSRAFTHLQNLGLIRLEGQRLVTIPSMRALQQFAGAEQPLPETQPVADVPSPLV